MKKLTATLVLTSNRKFFRSLIIVATLFWINTGSVKAQVANIQDSLQLVAFYDSTGGPNWTNRTGWLTTSPVRFWYGINLNSGGRVISVNLAQNNLAGRIPDLNLPFLTTLFLSSNHLTGSIPMFTGVPNLQILDLAVNLLSGSIPPLSLQQLKNLYLGRNPTSGTIPDFNLPSLVDISLYGNHLTGPIPNFNFQALQYLNLNANQLSGTIPNFNFPQLKRLDISENQLSGVIPDFNFLHVIEFNVWNNQLSGTIPNFNFPELRTALLHNNQLSGAIPNLNLPMLQSINLDHNHFSGPVPAFSFPDSAIINISYNNLLFDGLEYIEQHYPNAVYSPQYGIIAHKRDSILSVTAGGTLANDTCKWYRNNQLVATRIGDSTYTTSVPGFYSVKVTNSIATDLTLTSTNTLEMLPRIFKIDPNPSVITDSGTINTNLSGLSMNDTVVGASADGVSKVLLYMNSNSPIRFWIEGSSNGSLNSLTDTGNGTNSITISPNNGKVVAVYTVPDGLGVDLNLIYIPLFKPVLIRAASVGGVDSTVVNLDIVSPPVVMVHGMWSSPKAWDDLDDYLYDQFFPRSFRADYSTSSSATFDPRPGANPAGREAVRNTILLAISDFKRRKYATTKVDVIGHSLGGLMTRSFSKQNDFLNPYNYNQGYIHKLITLGTPHGGAPIGPLLYQNRTNVIYATHDNLGNLYYTRLEDIFKGLGNPIGQCHPDFQKSSEAYLALGATPPYYTYAIAGKFPANYFPFIAPTDVIHLAQINASTGTDWMFRVFFDKTHAEVYAATAPCAPNIEIANDLFVGVNSQKGGISNYKVFPETAHSIPALVTETNNEEIMDSIRSLLLSNDPSKFSFGFPAPTSIQQDCENGRTTIQDETALVISRTYNVAPPLLRISSPVRGAVYNQPIDSIVHLEYDLLNNAVPIHTVLMIEGYGWYPLRTVSPLGMDFVIPKNVFVGKIKLAVIARDTTGILYGDTLHIMIRPNGFLDSLAADPAHLILDSNLRSSSVYVKGYFKNDTIRNVYDLTKASTGTIYSAHQGNIFSVSENGLVTATNVGADTLIIANSGKTIKVLVTVANNFQNAYHYLNIINFPAISDKTIGDVPFGLDASATSGVDVVFTVVSGPGTIQNGILKMDTTGQITIKASQAGNVYFAPAADVFRTFCVRPVNPVVTQNCNTLSSNITNGNQWYKEGVAISGATNQSLFITSAGTYTAKVTSNGCHSVPSNSIVVTPGSFAPTPNIATGSPTTFCQGGSVTINSDAASGNQWYKDGIAINGSTGTILNVIASGSYTVKATVNGCESASSNAINVTVHPYPQTPVIIGGSSTTFCTGGNVSLTSNAVSGNQWYKNGVAITGSTGATLNVTSSGNYTTKVTVNGCESPSSNIIAVIVNLIPPSPVIAANTATTICAGENVILTSNSGTGNQWYRDGVVITGATATTLTVIVSGNYTTKVTLSGCESATSNAIAITVKTLPPTPSISKNGNQLMSNAGSGNQWFLDGNIIPGATAQNHIQTGQGNYTVQVIANGCKSAFSSAFNIASVPDIQVLPNPVRNKLIIIRSNTLGELNIRLFDINGKEIRKISSSTSITEIDMSVYEAGSYIIWIEDRDKKILVKKVIVKL